MKALWTFNAKLGSSTGTWGSEGKASLLKGCEHPPCSPGELLQRPGHEHLTQLKPHVVTADATRRVSLPGTSAVFGSSLRSPVDLVS